MVLALALAVLSASTRPAEAQRIRFERSFDVSSSVTLDVSTVRGKIDVVAGAAGRVVIIGTVTVRVAWDVPTNALEIARRVADRPPVEKTGDGVRLQPPDDAEERRAVTVSYEVRVPRDTRVRASSESGAITVHGVDGPIVVRTQSGAIALTRLGATVEVTTGSGAVDVDGVAGALRVTTTSSAIVARELRAAFHARTTSGDVQASFAGSGDVDVQTSSSAIRLQGVSGALTASTESGRVLASGTARGPWHVSTGSGSITVSFDSIAGLTLEAGSRSGSVRADGVPVTGTVSKGRVSGIIGGGGPLVRLESRSGSIRVQVRNDRSSVAGHHPSVVALGIKVRTGDLAWTILHTGRSPLQ
jgi:hypothetical protein